MSYRAVALGSGVPALIAAVPAGTEGVATLKGRDWGYGWNAGTMLELGNGVTIGAAYRSAIRHRLKGDVRFTDRPAPLGSVGQIADGSAETTVRLPSISSAGIAWKATNELTLLGDWSQTNWNVIQELLVVRSDGATAGGVLSRTPLRLKNSWRVGAGAAWEVARPLTLRAGIARETSAVQDQYRTPLLPDSDRISIGIGARYVYSKAIRLDFGFSYIRPRKTSLPLNNQDAPTSTPAGTLVGDLSSSARVFGGQLSGAFD